jgi:fumarate hydratase subunit beta
MKKIATPLTLEVISNLHAGDEVYINGDIYVGRDTAHKKLIEMIERGEELPFNLKGAIIYYMGPSPTKPGEIIGSAGPTTSGRMDKYTPHLLRLGLKGMIGKGFRSENVKTAIQEYKSIYFAALGGCGALIQKSVKKCEIIAFPEIGPEAIRKLEVENFPAIVVNSIYGEDAYEMGKKKYQKV